MPAFNHDEIDAGDLNDLIAYLRASRMSGPPFRPFRGR
jgi:hypothetical protein